MVVSKNKFYKQISAFMILLITLSGNFSIGQNITMTGANSGTTYTDADYTCGTSQIFGSVGDGEDIWICICPPAGEYAQIDFTNINLEDGGGSNPDDYLYVYEGCGIGGPLLYNPTPSAPNLTQTVTATAPDVCLTVRIEERGTGTGAGGTITATINCKPNCVDPSPFTSGLAGHIGEVDINSGTLTNPSGFDGYADNTGSCVSVLQGDDLLIDIDVVDNASYTLYTTAWIDWDGDGVFEASEEYDFGNITASTTHTINSFVPCDAAIGTVTMRVIMQYLNPITGPCVSTGIYGDVEDYCFTISPMVLPYAGPDQVLATCISNTSLSADPIDATYTGTWTFTTGGGVLSNPNDPNATITDLEPGVNTLLWTVVTPNCGNFTSSLTITTDGIPSPAIAGPDGFTCLSTYSLNAEPVVIGTGVWTVISGSGSVDTPTSNTSGVSGLVIGDPLTLQWTTTNGACISTDQITITMSAGVSTANAGSDQLLCTVDPAILNASVPTNGTGNWTSTGGVISDPSDPTSSVAGLIEGTYTFTWTVSGQGCTSSIDDVIITVEFCDPYITTVSCPGPVTFTSGAGVYSNDELIVQKYCPDIPGQYITATFTQVDFASSADHMIVLNGSDYSAPVIDDFYSLATIDNGPTIISSAEDGCLTFMFLSNSSLVDFGWTAAISCQVDSSTTNVEYCGWTNCLGGCLRTLCGIPATVPFTGDGIGNEELNAVNGGCLGLGEQCSNWFYINPVSAGTLTLDMFVNSGQDQDFAVWDAYGSQLQCPTMTGNPPLLCNFAPASAAGTGFNSSQPYSSYEPTLTITQAQIDANLYFIVLVNTYNPGGACPQPIVDVTFGGTAGLSCDPPIGLGVEMISFTGNGEGRFNELYWTTATEINNSHFELQGSLDGKNWKNIGTVEGVGTSFESNDYNLEDQTISARLTYYRIIQYDFDGEKTISHTIVIARELEINNIVSPIFPNPSSDNFNFNYGGSNFNTPIEIEIYNAVGKLVKTQKYSDFDKYVSLNFNVNELVDGLYQVKIAQGDLYEIQRISIVR